MLQELGVPPDQLRVQVFVDHVQVLFIGGRVDESFAAYVVEAGGLSRVKIEDLDGTVLLPADMFEKMAAGESLEKDVVPIGFDRANQDSAFTTTDSVFHIALPKEMQPHTSMVARRLREVARVDASMPSQKPFEIVYTEEVPQTPTDTTENEPALLDVVPDRIVMEAILDRKVRLPDNLSPKGFSDFIQKIQGRAQELDVLQMKESSVFDGVSARLKDTHIKSLSIRYASHTHPDQHPTFSWLAQSKVGRLVFGGDESLRLLSEISPESKEYIKTLELRIPLEESTTEDLNAVLKRVVHALLHGYPNLTEVVLDVSEYSMYSGNVRTVLGQLSRPSKMHPEGLYVRADFGVDGFLLFEKGEVTEHPESGGL